MNILYAGFQCVNTLPYGHHKLHEAHQAGTQFPTMFVVA